VRQLKIGDIVHVGLDEKNNFLRSQVLDDRLVGLSADLFRKRRKAIDYLRFKE
jgi:hypothetical protein